MEEGREAPSTRLAKVYSTLCRKKRELRDRLEYANTANVQSIAQQQELISSFHNLDASAQHLEELFSLSKKDFESFAKDLWRRRLNTFHYDMESIRHILQNHFGHTLDKRQHESELRKRLLEKPASETLLWSSHSNFSPSSMYNERQELMQADIALSSLLNQGNSLVKSLTHQNMLLKRARKTFFAFRASLDSSNLFMKMIFRRHKMDSVIVKLLMLLTVAFLFLCYYLIYFHYPVRQLF